MPLDTPVTLASSNVGGWSYIWYQIRHSPLVILGLAIVVAMLAIALLAPLLAPYDPYAVSLDDRLLPPSAAHWAGTDEIGRDLLSRIIYGARASLAVALAIVTIAASLGTLLGSFSGLAGGRIDAVIMRLTDTVMALPGLVIALAMTAALGPSLVNLALALGILGVPFYTRLARGQALGLRQMQYVLASRAMGASTSYVLRRHIVSNLLSTMVVFASMHISGALLAAAALSFIGLGAQPPTAELGALINVGRAYIQDEWWYSLIPGLVVVVSALGFNLLGDGIRDVLDPKSRKK